MYDNVMLTLLIVMVCHAPSQIASVEAPQGVVSFRIVDDQGDPIPGRLTFIDSTGLTKNIFPNPYANPTKLAVRDYAVYTIDGHGEITVPEGSWDIVASHGIEWSIDSTHIDVVDGGSYEWTAKLVHEIDTIDWVSGDFHLHTLTHSGHGDAIMNERIISIIGEGVEFAVATDHNHNTDYQPIIDGLHANEHLTAVVGNEVSTNYGHLNIFPLDASARVVDQSLPAPALFALIRAEQNPFGVVPIIQINHPRWGNIDYFGKRVLDPVTGESKHDSWSWDFDSIEILNENEGWGFYDAETSSVDSSSGKHSVLHDWYNMLNAGRRIVGVGNSDSHTVIANIAGIPRNYIFIGSDDASNIDPAAITNAIRSGRVFTTTGPFLRMTANGQPMGSTISIQNNVVDIHLDVQAASWIDLDTIRIILNGHEVVVVTIDQEAGVVKHARPRVRIAIPHDSWIIAIAQGDEAMSTYLKNTTRSVYPLAITNPIYIDADGDGVWTPPVQWIGSLLQEAQGNIESVINLYNELSPAEAAILVLACADDSRIASQLIHLALTSDVRILQLAACRAAIQLKDASLLPTLAALIDDPKVDRYLGFSAWAACDTLNQDLGVELMDRYVKKFGWSNTRRFSTEYPLHLAGDFIREWQVCGYFAAPEMEYLTHAQAPEPNITHITSPKTLSGDSYTWTESVTNDDGYLDLLPENGMNNAIAYAKCWIWSPKLQDVDFTIGSDDGCRIWMGDSLVWDDQSRHWAYPDYKRGTMTLQEGWNPLLVKILNRTKGMGFYLRVLDDEITYESSQPTM